MEEWEVCVVVKDSNVFVGEIQSVGENGIHLKYARRVKEDPFLVAGLVLGKTCLCFLMGPIVEELIIYKPELLLKPRPSIADALRSICGSGAIADEP